MTTPEHILQNLSNRSIYRVTGSDAEHYLNGQVSQDVTLASEKSAIYSIVANFKGKLAGDCYIRRHKGDLLIDTCSTQKESLFNRLDRYLIADDAEITDISDELKIFHEIGVSDLDLTHPSWQCNRYGTAGLDYIIPSSENLPKQSQDHRCEQIRISNKIPIWGKELDENTLPPEAALEDRAISYTKGCYTGQEVISRMKSAGKTNRHLVNFQSESEILAPLDLMITDEGNGKPAAQITSSCLIDGKWIGLGYRTRKAENLSEFYDSKGNKHVII